MVFSGWLFFPFALPFLLPLCLSTELKVRDTAKYGEDMVSVSMAARDSTDVGSGHDPSCETIVETLPLVLDYGSDGVYVNGSFFLKTSEEECARDTPLAPTPALAGKEEVKAHEGSTTAESFAHAIEQTSKGNVDWLINFYDFQSGAFRDKEFWSIVFRTSQRNLNSFVWALVLCKSALQDKPKSPKSAKTPKSARDALIRVEALIESVCKRNDIKKSNVVQVLRAGTKEAALELLAGARLEVWPAELQEYMVASFATETGRLTFMQISQRLRLLLAYPKHAEAFVARLNGRIPVASLAFFYNYYFLGLEPAVSAKHLVQYAELLLEHTKTKVGFQALAASVLFQKPHMKRLLKLAAEKCCIKLDSTSAPYTPKRAKDHSSAGGTLYLQPYTPFSFANTALPREILTWISVSGKTVGGCFKAFVSAKNELVFQNLPGNTFLTILRGDAMVLQATGAMVSFFPLKVGDVVILDDGTCKSGTCHSVEHYFWWQSNALFVAMVKADVVSEEELWVFVEAEKVAGNEDVC